MRRLPIICILLVVSVFAFAQAKISSVHGRVEILAPGGSWAPAEVGMVLAESSVISTGFNSSAVVDSELSTLVVKPLTRIRLDELVRQQDGARTTVFLTVGRVRAEVRTAEGLRHDFKLRSPMSTAAVRGTTIDFARTNLKVIVGSARLSNRLNQGRSVGAGEESSTSGDSAPTKGEGGRAAQTTVSSRVVAGGGNPPVSDPTDSLGDLAGGAGEDLFGTIVVTTYFF